MKLKQIVLSIENAPERLYEVTNALGKAGINLRALNLVDTGEFGQLRMLVSDVATARRILMEMHMPAFITEVVAAEIPDIPKSLANLLKLLKDTGIYPNNMYAFHGCSPGKAIMVFRFSNNDRAIEILQEHGVTLLDAKAFGILESGK